MTWRTEVQKVTYDVGETFKSGIESSTDFFRSLGGGISSKVDQLWSGTDCVGIDANQIPAMREAIRVYVQDLETHLNNVKTNIKTDGAFKGEYAAAITAYVEAVAEACKCVTSKLLEFSDRLKLIKDAYEKQDTAMQSKIQTTSSQVESQFTKYTEKY